MMAGNPLTDPDWARDLTDRIVGAIDSVRNKTTKPVVTAARAVVFGIIAACGGLAALVLVLIVLTRLLQAFIQTPIGRDVPTSVWISDIAVGALLCAAGALLFRKRHPRAARGDRQ